MRPNEAELISRNHEEEQEYSWDTDLLKKIVSLDQIEEKPAEWLVEGYIPRGSITTLAADGGEGKTSIAVSIASALSDGRPCFLEDGEMRRDPARVMYCSAEESVSVVIKARFAAAMANPKNVIVPCEDVISKLKIGSQFLYNMVVLQKPVLCIFDPIQGFLPDGCKITDRADMRRCLTQLVTLGSITGTSFLLVAHTNKRENASGRNRIADSSDLWDISRPVLIAGSTGDRQTRYLSHEKNNFGEQHDTILFQISESKTIVKVGKTLLKDLDFQQEKIHSHMSKKDFAKMWILETLNTKGGRMLSSELLAEAQQRGMTSRTIERARSDMRKDGIVSCTNEGFGSKKKHYLCLQQPPM